MAQAGEITVGGVSAPDEIVASIADAILIQRFVLELCLKNGLDPDSPAGLSKVTLTY
jgi:fructoselysine-6-P-deglycase FrlB-like protein